MLRVAEHFAHTDTGRQRRGNEDSFFARSPLFAVADGMGGAQAGEIASRVAIDVLQDGLPDGAGSPEERLAGLVGEANAHVFELSRSGREYAGMGTTLTAAYLGEEELAIAHVGDSRLYLLRDGSFERLTRDHSLVEELVQRGEITAEEADQHPQRSIITRALGQERGIEVDRASWRARAGDVYLICSDGLTSMVTSEARVGELIAAGPDLREAGHRLIEAANDAGGRDNITVILFRLEEVGAPGPRTDQDTATDLAAVGSAQATAVHEVPVADGSGRPGARAATPPSRRRRRARNAAKILFVLGLLGLPVLGGGYIASQSVYFLGVDDQGLLTLYQGMPYDGPASLSLYSVNYTSGVPAATLPAPVRQVVVDHKLRSRRDASDLVTRIERGELEGQDG